MANQRFDHGPVSGQAASRRGLDDKVIPRPGVRADCLPGFMHASSAQQPNPVSPLGGLGLYVPIPGSTSYLLPIIYGSSAFTGVKPCFPEKILRKQTSRFASAKLFTWRKPNFTFCASRKLHDKRRFPIQEPPFIMAYSVFYLTQTPSEPT